MTKTLVFMHAHPDDEALLTSGTMARAVAEGNRVILIVATNGEAGLTAGSMKKGLGSRRMSELEESTRAIGVTRTIALGYHDSGLYGEIISGFAHTDVEKVAAAVTAVLDEERADVVIGYDPSGGYGHPDHLQVHRVVRLAVAHAATQPQLFEATLPREPIVRAVRTAKALHLTPKDFDPAEFANAWTPKADITHRVNVREYLAQKRASLRAHASQASADGTVRTLGVIAKLPPRVLGGIMGTEYYVKVASASSTSDGLSALTH